MARDGAECAGRIPYRLWVGVVGDRHIEHHDAVRAAVGEAIQRIRRWYPPTETDVVLGVVCSLAEDTELFVAEEILKDDTAVLEVPLPLARADYIADLKTRDSPTDVDKLLGRATTKMASTSSTPLSDVIARAEEEVVARCDVLIAVWDGSEDDGECRTAAIIGSACERVPVLWVRSSGDPEIENLGVVDIDLAEYQALSRYNADRHVGAGSYETELECWDGRLPAGDDCRERRLELRAFSHWIVPYYVRADRLALHYQRVFRWMFLLVSALAVAAVTIVTWGAVGSLENKNYAKVEVALLIVIFCIVVRGRRARWHERWTASRFFAERLRSTYFWAIAGVERRPGDLERTPPERPPRTRWRRHHRESIEWVGRSLSEIWNSKPPIEIADVDLLRSFLADEWIEDQRLFHRQRANHNRAWSTFIEWSIVGLFSLTVGAGLLHIWEPNLLHHHTWELIVAAVFLPTFAGLLGAVELEHEYRRNADRYAETVRQLTEIGRRIDRATDLATIRQVAEATEGLLVRETRNWYSLLKVHDLEFK